MAGTKNYTEEQEEFLRVAYLDLGTEKMDSIVIRYNKEFGTDRNIRSIRGKIMLMNDADGNPIYAALKKEPKKPVDRGPTKADTLAEIVAMVGNSFSSAGLENATKDGINSVRALAVELVQLREAS